jgi:uncharacterized membrane protein
MPLSKEEQRALDEIARALSDDDPDLANSLSLDHLRRHRLVVGVVVFTVGFVLLIGGIVAALAFVVVGTAVSIAGFLGMFGGMAYLFRDRRPQFNAQPVDDSRRMAS